MTKRVSFYKIKEKDKGRISLKKAKGARYALILLALGILLFAACDKIHSTEFYTVSGYVETDADTIISRFTSTTSKATLKSPTTVRFLSAI